MTRLYLFVTLIKLHLPVIDLFKTKYKQVKTFYIGIKAAYKATFTRLISQNWAQKQTFGRILYNYQTANVF